MRKRLALAVLLGVTVSAGCAAVQEDTISLIADKPARSGWPWKRTLPQTRSAPAPALKADPPPAAPLRSRASAADQFLASLPAELRDRINRELADAPADERQRLLDYLATVDASRIPALLDARRDQKSAVSSTPQVVQGAQLGQPEFELAAVEPPTSRVELASAEVPALPAGERRESRPKRNPLIELDPAAVEFEDPAESTPFPAAPSTPAPPPSRSPDPATEPPAAAAAVNPLARLREWTTIRKTDASEPAAEPAQTAMASSDPSALSIQGISRRLRGGKPESSPSLQSAAGPGSADETYLLEGIQKVIALMEAETARLKPGATFVEREEYIRRHAELRMLYLMSRQPTLAQQAIPGTDAETQEFWTALMWALSNYFDNESIGDPAERAAVSLDRLRIAEQHLQTLARLEVRSLAFCDRIDGFGAYHPFERDVFRPGQPVLLYAEVRNFKTDVTPSGRYRTALRSTVEIVRAGEGGELIERRQFESTEDQSRSPRTDYFHSYKLDLPLHMTPGTYTLRLTLEDELSTKIGASTIDFLVR